MSNIVSLDSIRQAAEEKFGSTVIPLGEGKEVELVNATRLGKAKRARLSTVLSDPELDVEERLESVIRLVAKDEVQAEALITELDGDIPALAVVVEVYTTGTALGEASPSES